ncbi:MAG: YeiH family protein [Bacteroidetes bacterium]|nr:YeiH family protein [Bacteroidota bacterium]
MMKKQVLSEDWLSFWLGLVIFLFAFGVFVGLDLLGWGVKTSVWTDISKSLSPVSKNYSGISGIISVFITYLFMLVIVGIGNRLLGGDLKKFFIGFTFVFFISFFCWLAGHWAWIAATKDEWAKFGLSWSLNLTGEAGFIIALIVGLVVGNFFPKFSDLIKEAIKPELYIKTAIVIMGAGLGLKAAEKAGLASTIMFVGLCAIVCAYLIYWAMVYFIARRFFHFSKEWAAPLASGISICGVSAAIATGGAIRARPVIPIMVSSLVVIFAVVELLVLPFLAQTFLWQEPLVAGSWMGLVVKTDGAAIASGAITDGLIRAKAMAMEGVKYQEGWILMTSTTVKVFIDVFIGIWAFILAIIWAAKIEKRKEGDKLRASEIWQRFPKFVIGYMLTFILFLTVCMSEPKIIDTAKKVTDEADVFRKLFFVFTFFTIGVVSNFKKLWEEGIGKLALIYILCLFGFIIWIGLLISWLFFSGAKPPLMP